MLPVIVSLYSMLMSQYRTPFYKAVAALRKGHSPY